MNKQVANLQLRTCDGVLNGGYNNTCTWQVDMRNVLGDLWNKYKYFNLTLKCIAWDVLPAGVGSNTSSLLNTYYMTGLQWVNCNYDTRINQIRDRSCIGTAYVPNYISAINSTFNINPANVVNSFQKSTTSLVDITISVYNISTNALAQMGTTGSRSLPFTIYDFSITPCEDDSEICSLLTLYEGVTSNSGATQTFKNIDFRLLLGELWGKYDTYSVELVDLQASPFAGYAVNANSVVSTVELSGLSPIVNSNDKTVVLGTASFNITLSYINFGNAPEVENKTIVKLNNRNDIVINFNSIVTNSIITATSGSMGKHVFQLLFKPIT